jgi:hypothetical protein
VESSDFSGQLFALESFQSCSPFSLLFFLHFFWMVRVWTQDPSPFFKVKVLDRVLLLASHSLQAPFV